MSLEGPAAASDARPASIDGTDLESAAKRARTEPPAPHGVEPASGSPAEQPPTNNVSKFKVGGSKWEKHGMSGTTLSFTPSQPPEAPKEEKVRSVYRAGDRKQDYTPKDTILCYLYPAPQVLVLTNDHTRAPMHAELYRARSKVYDRCEASKYMRWWFKEHERLPIKPPPAPRSAYFMYCVEQKRVTFEKNGKWDQKKDTKKVGAAWQTLTAEVRQGYDSRFEQCCDQVEAQHDEYDAALELWRKQRAEHLATIVTDPQERQKVGLNPICTCKYCNGDD